MTGLREYQLPAASAPAIRSGESPQTLAVTALSIGLFSIIFLQRFAFNVAGYPIQMVLLLVVAVLAYLLWQRIACLDSVRLLGFFLLTCILALEGLITRGAGSILSLGLLLVIYVLNTLVITMSRETYIELLRSFQWMMVIAAALGLAQFFGQFVVPAEYLFSFKHFVPSSMLMDGFNTVIPVRDGSDVFKSNGFVFVEPSTFSQFLAVAIIVELAVFHSSRRLAAFTFAYLFTYSGTGLVILVAALPLFLGSLRAKHLLIGMLLIVGC